MYKRQNLNTSHDVSKRYRLLTRYRENIFEVWICEGNDAFHHSTRVVPRKMCIRDRYDENGILIQKYGPHYLNTNNYNVIKYLKQFADLYPHDAKLLSYICLLYTSNQE